MRATIGLSAEPASVSAARRFASRQLEKWHCTDDDEIVVLLVSELVTNAVLHARSAIGLTLRLTEDLVRVEVHDESPRAPMPRSYSKESGTGRGLRLVADLADAWGVVPAVGGKTVWFEKRVGAPVDDESGREAEQ